MGLPPHPPPGGNDSSQTPPLSAHPRKTRVRRQWGCRGFNPLPEGFGEAEPPRTHRVRKEFQAVPHARRITRIDASAGSGKTYRITRRFLALMRRAARVYPPPGCDWERPHNDYALSEILAATFTNRAAAEMKTRIVTGLKNAALARLKAGRSGGRAERQVAAVLRHYGALNVRTIDSLLNALVRLSALELGLPPDFEPSFDPQDYFTPLYDALMRDLGDHAADPVFLSTNAAALRAALEQACRAGLFSARSTGFSLHGKLHKGLHEIFLLHLGGRTIPAMDQDFVLESAGRLKARLDRALAELFIFVETEDLVLRVDCGKSLVQCRSLDLFGLPSATSAISKIVLAECLTKKSPHASDAAEAAFAEFLRAYGERAAVLPLLQDAAGFAPLTVLVEELRQRAEVFWRRERLLPAPAVPFLAARLLSGEYGVSDALCRFGARLTHILLDEFQDTSREQWAAVAPLALEALSRGGTLAYVGDVKQAIYSWRGGDARLFTEAARDPELRAVSGVNFRKLPYNRRSCAEIVTFNNAAFGLLGEEATATATLAAMLPDHTPPEYLRNAVAETTAVFSDAAQGLPPGASSGGRVCLYEARGQNSGAVDAAVAARLHRLFAEELLPRRPLRDIALLTRSREEISSLAALLAGWGVPVVTEESFLPAEHPLVAGIVDLLAFLQYPADDAAFWGSLALLRESDPDAPREAVCARILKKREKRGPLYRLFAEARPEQWKTLFEPLLRRAGLMSAYDLIAEIIRRFGLPMEDAANGPFLRRLLETAHLAEGRGFSSPAAFLDFWRERCMEEKLPLPEGMDAVRLMTTHAAKGLEFPVVVLPSLHRGKDNTPAPTVFEHRGVSLLTKARPELPELFYPARITSIMEHLNLLYVAWTRPREELHAFITRPVRGGGPLSRGLEALTAALRERAPETFAFEELPTASSGTGVAGELVGTSARELPPLLPAPAEDAWRSDAAPDGPTQFFAGPTDGTMRQKNCKPQTHTEDGHASTEPPHDASASEDPAGRLARLKIYRSVLQKPAFTPERRGILAHLCLENLHLSGPGREEEDVTRAVAHAMRLFPLPLENPEAAAEAVREALLWFVRQPETPRLLRLGLREQGIIDASGNRLRADLLVPDEHEVVALDYKTGRPDPAHERQVRTYMTLAGTVLGKSARGVLVYLDERRIVEVAP